MPLLLGFGFVIIAVLVINYAQKLLNHLRTHRVSVLAEELDFTFTAEKKPPDPGIPGDFLLFAQGIPTSIHNVMNGQYVESLVSIYEYTFVQDLGRYEESFIQTVIQINLEGARLPQFTLIPQNQLDAILHNMSDKDGRDRLLETAGIRTPKHPEFREKYKLIGSDHRLLRNIFDNDIIIDKLSELDNKPYAGLVCIEGFMQHIILYPLYTRIPVKRINDFLSYSLDLAHLISSDSREEI